MEKYQEKIFKDFVKTIEGLAGDYDYFCKNSDFKKMNVILKDLKEARIEFFNWANRNFK